MRWQLSRAVSRIGSISLMTGFWAMTEISSPVMRSLAMVGIILAVVGFATSCSVVSSVLSTDPGLSVPKADDPSSRRIPLPPTVEDFRPQE